MEKKSVFVHIQSAFSEIAKQLTREGLSRIATNCLKINIIRFIRIRAGDIGVGIVDSPTISHEEVLGPWCITQNRTVKKGCNEEKIDRLADLADPSPGICKAVARHVVDPRFIGISVFVSLSLFLSLSPRKFFLALPRHFVTAWAGSK